MTSGVACRMQGVRTVEYGLAKFKGSLCSTCRLFTDEITVFVPAYKIFLRNSVGSIADTLALCRDMGFERKFTDTVVLDTVTFNQDRHLGNFGFLVNNDTFEIKSFAPLFDFNMAILCFTTVGDLETGEAVALYFERNDVGRQLEGNFAKVAKALMTPEHQDRMPQAIQLPRHYRYNLADERMNRLDAVFQQHYDYVVHSRARDWTWTGSRKGTAGQVLWLPSGRRPKKPRTASSPETDSRLC